MSCQIAEGLGPEGTARGQRAGAQQTEAGIPLFIWCEVVRCQRRQTSAPGQPVSAEAYMPSCPSWFS